MDCRVRFLSSVVLLSFAFGCGSGPKAKKTEKTTLLPATLGIDASDVEAHNRGVALMGKFQFNRALPNFTELARKYPAWLDVKVDAAIAQWHSNGSELRAAGGAGNGSEGAGKLLQEVLERDPKHLRANYCYGVMKAENGEYAEAERHLRIVVEGDPKDAMAAYKLAECLLVQQKSDESLKWLQKAVEIQPTLASAVFRQISALNQKGDKAGAKRMMDAHTRLKAETAFAATWALRYHFMGAKMDVLPLGKAESSSVFPPIPTEPIFEAPSTIALPAGFVWNKGKDSGGPTITACDIDGDGRTDLFVARAFEGGPIANAVLLKQADGSFRLDAGHSLAKPTGVNAALWGDVDNDGRTDVYLCRDDGNQLWLQTKPGVWTDATAATGAAGSRGARNGLLADLDHDGDLDLLLIGKDGTLETLLNFGTRSPGKTNWQAKFVKAEAGRGIEERNVRQVLLLDVDGDRDLDALVIHDKPPHSLWLNDRTWAFHKATGYDELLNSDAHSAVAVDIDGDGLPEIYASSPTGLVRWARDASGEMRSTQLVKTFGGGPGTCRQLMLADFIGRGVPDLLQVGWGWEVYAIDEGGGLNHLKGARAVAASLAAVYIDEPSVGPGVVAFGDSNELQLWKPASNGKPRLSIRLSGDKDAENPIHYSNRSGIGTQALLRLGARWCIQRDLSQASGPGQSLQPLSFGLGGAKEPDFLAVEWSNGDLQTELDLKAGATNVVTEQDRNPDSCPVLFAWNGEKHGFLSDVLGVGGLGYLVRPGEYYTPTDPREHFLVPEGAIQPIDGKLDFRLVETTEEITLLDSMHVSTYDLPPGWRMTLDERHSAIAPRVTHQPVFFRREAAPAAAVDQTGKDVTAALQRVDYRPAPPPPKDPKYNGRFAVDHVLTMTFAEPLDAGPGAPRLVADGWVEFPNSQTVFAAMQSGEEYPAPRLEARGADGTWKVVHPEFGYPAGMQRQMSLPLPGLPKGARELRLTTRLQICWDRIAVVFEEPCPQALVRRLSPADARVGRCGIPACRRGDDNRPWFDYGANDMRRWARHPLGLFTKFGACKELVEQDDDAVAVIGAGEEVACRFPAPEPAAAGWTRRYVVELRGWCKDMGLYTKDGSTVEPLPTTGKPAEAREFLHRRFNTRSEGGL